MSNSKKFDIRLIEDGATWTAQSLVVRQLKKLSFQKAKTVLRQKPKLKRGLTLSWYRF